MHGSPADQRVSPSSVNQDQQEPIHDTQVNDRQSELDEEEEEEEKAPKKEKAKKLE